MKTLEKNAGLSLIFGSVLLVATMILHPAHLDEGFERVNIISHALAITAIPFCLFGFWGLSKCFNRNAFLPNIAFPVMATGLIAGMFAAAFNGLVLTFFIRQYRNTSETTAEIVDVVLHYAIALNHAMDYIFIAATMVAVLFWSVAMIRTSGFPKWLGYYGMLLIAAGLVLAFTGFEMFSVAGFRIIIFGMVSWILITGYMMMNTKNGSEE